MVRELLGHLADIFKKPEIPDKRADWDNMRFFFRYVKPLWKLGIVSICLTIASTSLGSLLPLTGKLLIDFVIMGKGADKIQSALESLHLGFAAPHMTAVLSSANLVVALVLVAAFAIGLLNMVQKYLTLKFQQEVLFNIQTTLFERLLRFPPFLLRRQKTGYLISRVSADIDYLQFFFSGMIPRFLSAMFYIGFSFALLFTLNVPIALIVAGLVPVWIAIYVFFSIRTRAVGYQELERRAQISDHMHEAISGAEVIKTFVSEKTEVEKLSGRIRGLFRTKLKTSLLNSLSENAVKGSKIIAILFVVWMCVRQIQNQAMTIGDMTAILGYIVLISSLAQGLGSAFILLQPVLVAMERIKEMFDVVPEYEEKSTVIPESVLGEIRFHDVFFHYEKKKPVLHGITLNVKAGECVTLTGPSGAGKTTLINLLIKFHRPVQGQIFIDGRPLDDIDTMWLRKQIGFVSQDLFLFDDTVKNNIRYGRKDATFDEIVLAARQAGIHDAIEKLKDGYNTVVGERGMQLSAGQRQRISIARAFLKNPAILILDEPTSALDAGTEETLTASLKKLVENKTAIIISHRMALTKVSDRIFRLSNGMATEISAQNIRSE